MRRNAKLTKSTSKCVESSDMKRRGNVIDLFCGAGGLTHGFRLEGFRIAKGIDIDKSCRYPFETNNDAPFVQKCIRDVNGAKLFENLGYNEPKILVGCAPCQPFSKYSQKKDDSRWSLLEEFTRLIGEASPDIVSMENVPSLAKFKGGSVFKKFLDELWKFGYKVKWSVAFCPEFGVPQSRSRLVLLASRFGEPPDLEKTHKAEDFFTVRDSIGDLPEIAAGEVHSSDPLHRSSVLSSKNLDRIRSSIQGGTWHDWPEDLVTNCHARDSGMSFTSVYGRMSWDKPAPTMTTQFIGFGNGRFGHPEQNRAISLREGALLQTFPKDYEFVAPGSRVIMKTLGKLIGNAVPVNLARAIAKAISKHIEGCR